MSLEGKVGWKEPAVAPAAPSAGPPTSIAERLDRLPLSGLHVAIVVVCTLGLFADIAEVAISNALAAIFMAPPHRMPRGDLALLLASVFLGGAFGAPVFGALGDRFGRRRAIQAALALMALGSLAAAASPDLTSLTVARFVSGFAIGGYPPLCATYLSDCLPPRRRGALMLVVTGIGFLGAPALILLIRWLTPLAPLGIEGWRWAIAAGGILAGLAALLFVRLPESPRWLAAAGRRADAEDACRRFEAAAGLPSPRPSGSLDGSEAPRTGFRALAADAGLLRRTGLFLLLFFLAPWATIAFPLLSAAVLIQKGFQVDQSLVFAALTMLGPCIGNLGTAFVVDRLGRRACLVLCAAAMAAMGTLFAESGVLWVLMIAGIVFNTAAATYNGVVTLYCSELLPTPLRASALTCAWAAGRIAAALAPITLLPLLAGYGTHAMFAVITGALMASAALILAGPRGLSGKPVA
jgi:putative MFS transporter